LVSKKRWTVNLADNVDSVSMQPQSQQDTGPLGKVQNAPTKISESRRLWWTIFLLALLSTVVAIDAALERQTIKGLTLEVSQLRDSIRASSLVDSSLRAQLDVNTRSLDSKTHGLDRLKFSDDGKTVTISGPDKAKIDFFWDSSGAPGISLFDSDGHKRFATGVTAPGYSRAGQYCVFVYALGSETTSRYLCDTP